MPHNPILNRQPMLRGAASPEIRRGTVGLLYQRGQLLRQLKPDEKLSWRERWSGDLVMYTVDMRVHPIALNFSLPAKHEHDRFPLRVILDYQVEDGERMVGQSIDDTERLVASALEDLLRPVCRSFTLDQHNQLLQKLEDVVRADFLSVYGLRKTRCIVDLRIDSTFQERVQQLKDLDLPQSRTREVRLPSSLPGVAFHAKVGLTYHVIDRTKLPSEILSRVEEQLWPQVESRLWSLSRGFKIGQEAEAEQTIRAGIEEARPQGYGLEIQSISVTIEPDRSTTSYQQRHIQVSRDRVLAKSQDQALAEQKQRQRELTREELALYGAIFKDGELLALKLAQNPALVDEVLDHLSAQDREQFQRDVVKIQLLMEESAHSDKGLFDDQRRNLSQAILNSISKNFKSLSGLAGLLIEEPFTELPEAEEAIVGVSTPATAAGTPTPDKPTGDTAEKGDDNLEKQVSGPTIET